MRLLSGVLVVCLLSASCPVRLFAQTTEADVYVQQAVIDFDDKQYDSAVANLQKALELEPDHIEALYYMGVVNMARRQTAEAIPWLLKARARAPSDRAVAFQLGLAYFGLQQYDKAQPLLEEVYRADPTLDGLGYYVGFMRYRAKDYRGALNAFKTGRASDPDIQQLVRFYTGLALAVLGLPTQAAAEVEQALRLAPGSPLTGPAERLRDTIVAARGKEHLLSAELRLGVTYDDNVSVIPSQDGNEPLVGDLRHAKHESPGELAGLRVDYSWLRPLLKRDDWDSTVGYSFFMTYNNEITRFNVVDHLVNATVTHKGTLGAMPLQTGAQYAFDVLYLDGSEFTRRNTVTLFGAVAEGSIAGIGNNITQTFARFQTKHFPRIEGTVRREIRSGDNYMLGFLHLVGFRDDRHFVKLGYQFDFDDTQGLNYEYRGHRLLAGGQYTLPWRGVRLKDDVDVHLRDYTHTNSQLPSNAPGTKRRQDEEVTNVARVEVPIMTTCVTKDDCIGWTVAAEYQYTRALSNIAIFDYARNVVSLTLSLTY